MYNRKTHWLRVIQINCHTNFHLRSPSLFFWAPFFFFFFFFLAPHRLLIGFFVGGFSEDDKLSFWPHPHDVPSFPFQSVSLSMLAHVQLIRTLPTSNAVPLSFVFFHQQRGVSYCIDCRSKESMSFHVPLFGPLVRVCVHVSVSSTFF